MTTSSFAVSPLATEADVQRHFMAGYKEFMSGAPPERARQYQDDVTMRPGFRSQSLRGAYHEGQLAGGYILFEWVMRMGAARIPTGCIGSVVTYPEFRKQGVASALMQ